MSQEPGHEISIMGWALQSPPEEFFPLSNKLKDLHFQSHALKILWKRLIAIFESHGTFPSESEIPQVITSIADIDPASRSVYQDLLRKCYDQDVTGFTGEIITNWVAERSLAELSIQINSWSSGAKTRTLPEILEHTRAIVDDLEQLGTESSIGTEFRPLSAEAIREPQKTIEASFAGEPFPTGYPGIDLRLRHRGFRGHGAIIFGPTGTGKTEFVLNMALGGCRNGARVVWISFDDDPGELTERMYSNMLRESFRLMYAQNPGWANQRLGAAWEQQITGIFEGIRVQPSTHTPQDLIRALQKLQRRFIREDMAAIATGQVVIDTPGQIDLLVFDTADQIKAFRHYQKEWYELEKMFEQVCGMPMFFRCPVILTSQGGQDTLGASQATLRNIANAFGKVRPAKFVAALSQTYHQIHQRKEINFTHPKVAANIHHLRNMGVDPHLDRDTKWEPFWVCILKNTLADDSVYDYVRMIKLPFLTHHRSCRVVEDFEQEPEPIWEDRKTQREERQAEGRSEPPAVDNKRGAK